MKTQNIEEVEVQRDELEELRQEAEATLSKERYEILQKLLDAYLYMTQLIEDKETTIKQLRKLFFGSKSEKTEDVLGDPQEDPGEVDREASESDHSEEEKGEKKKRKGHGRNGAEAYTGAERIEVSHESLESGDSCPECEKGKVYKLSKPGVIVRIVGEAPVKAKVYELEKLRCNLCGTVFTAKAPEGIGEEKYDASSASMVGLLKYGSGLPFNRLQRLQGNLGIPLPASTQWDLVHSRSRLIEPAYAELIWQAAQGEVLHNDDTTGKILELMGKRLEARGEDPAERKGIFTSGIVSIAGGQRIALFFTGRKHAGENLAKVLSERVPELGPPIQMCDALAQNVCGDFKAIVANCIAHARRRFVDVVENFPEECRFVLESLRDVYRIDARARIQDLSPRERLELHQAESKPLMDALQKWLTEQFEEKKVEPNSSLGQAITYMTEHWEKLTLFLREPGAPLDNNIVERSLKKAILHRKSALFFKTENGARVGDLFMSLIHTAELSGINAFDYLLELQRHAKELKENPSEWMPWNYRQTLKRTADLRQS